MYRCMICGWPAEVRYVPATKIRGQGGDVYVYVSPYQRRAGEVVVGETKTKRIFCRCNNGNGRHP